LKELPEEIGNLSNLEMIFAAFSSIESLPASFGRLKVCLRGLFLRGTSIPEIRENDPYDLLWKLVREFPLFGHLGGGNQQLQLALACNRARSRINFGSNDDKKCSPIEPKMWPLILRHAKRAFQSYEFEGVNDLHRDGDPSNEDLLGDGFEDDWRPEFDEQPDAIYQLLAIGRVSFVRLLIDRKRTNDTPNSVTSPIDIGF